MLTVDGLRFAYPTLPLFDGWSHEFPPGLTWIRGDNGSGKSTLLQLLAGSLEAQAGRLCVDGVDPDGDRVEYRRRVCRCSADGPAFDALRPAEFFDLVARLHPRFDAAIADGLVASLGLEPFIGKPIRALSTGTRRKVAVVAGIAACTDVLLLDEPLAALDRASADVVRRLLAAAAARRERIWIVTSHEPLATPVDTTVHLVDLPSRE